MAYAPRPNPRPPPKRRPWSQPLADFVQQALSPTLAKHGFGEADIILNWDEIAGSRLAAVCEPVRILWPGRGPKTSPDAASEPAVLVLRVEGAFALEIQHSAPILIERVNTHLGWRCIGRIAIRQAPLEKRAVKKGPPPRDAQADAQAQALLAGMEPGELRDALAMLGGRVLAQKGAKG